MRTQDKQKGMINKPQTYPLQLHSTENFQSTNKDLSRRRSKIEALVAKIRKNNKRKKKVKDRQQQQKDETFIRRKKYTQNVQKKRKLRKTQIRLRTKNNLTR
jgi:hypothetical protein